ncbi:hypothetical protein CAPTEDRAFT_125710 [Capitella teleta]|uniref:Sugar phosphate transporter domain-containing protein n=1 Tax=Capitella teleta TaxID=283909 RepID=R7URS9_CAPTE|nr:hypothetical protein CAPTEDRAFT_125710 [Capitella teleta]|eukprot:ELU08858.1 hypothetical protein CAPTEDRAFT_125710 [Capitella teleta]
MVYASYTILVHLCERNGEISFSSSAMVFVTEVMKLLISLSLLLKESTSTVLSLPSFKEVLPFSIPAVLYTFNNNLAVHMQLQMDPATYQVLSNLKILTTAALYRMIIKRPISVLQWIALGMLTLAGAFNSYGGLQSSTESMSAGVIHLTLQGLLMISLYALVSGLAGVYMEFILKRRYEAEFNQILILFFCTIFTVEDGNLFNGFNIFTWILICSQAVCGLIMSAVMKHGNNITRLFLISCAMLVTTLLSIAIFYLKLNVYFCISFLLVIGALILYHKT